MRKFFTLIVAALVGQFAMMASTAFTFTNAASVNQTKDGITVSIAKGAGNNDPAVYNDALRLYANNTITISGNDLKNIELSFTKQGTKEYATLSASAGTLLSGAVSTSNTNIVTDTWSGSTNSVTFTLGSTGQRIITGITVNGDGSGGSDTPSTPDPDEPDTPSTLDPDFVYPEPTILGIPSNKVQGQPYTFILNNVEVSSTMGAISDSYFSAHAGYDLTFTATRNIKGIVINGLVKKGFVATVNHGEIEYLSPSGADTEADPVVVITDVNSKSVTISCIKQLRCYSVEIYFEENPEASIGGSGEMVDLTFDSAEAVYESEYVEFFGEENYSIYLYNESEYDPYLALDIYPASKDDITGTYSWNDYTLGDYTYYVYGAGEDDFTWADDGEVTITRNGNNYSITGWITCDNGNTYNISFSGNMPFYTDDEYYGDGEDPGNGEEIDITFFVAEAVYESQIVEIEGMYNYSIYLYEPAVPNSFFALDINVRKLNDLTGTFDASDGTLGKYTMYVKDSGSNDLDSTQIDAMTDGIVTISQTGNIYSIFGIIESQSGKTYNIDFTGEIPIYTDDEYYGDGDSSRIKNVTVLDPDAPMYDLMGRQVGKDYRGIYIQNGRKYIAR